MKSRHTDLTDEQRTAMAHARDLLAPHFGGETVRLYLPKMAIELKLAREERMRTALSRGEPPGAVAQHEGVSRRTVYAFRTRLLCSFPP